MKLVVCFISPRRRLGDIKTHNSFHKYRMKWKFISDPIYICDRNILSNIWEKYIQKVNELNQSLISLTISMVTHSWCIVINYVKYNLDLTRQLKSNGLDKMWTDWYVYTERWRDRQGDFYIPKFCFRWFNICLNTIGLIVVTWQRANNRVGRRTPWRACNWVQKWRWTIQDVGQWPSCYKSLRIIFYTDLLTV